MRRMNISGTSALMLGLGVCICLLWTGAASEGTAEAESSDDAAEIRDLVDDLGGDVATLKILLSRIDRSLDAVSGKAGKDIHGQYDRLEEMVNAIEENADHLGELAEDPITNKNEMKTLVVNKLFMQIQQFEEINDQMNDLVNKAHADFSDPDDEKKIQETIEHFGKVQGITFKHIGVLGAKLQDTIVWEYKESLGSLNPNRLDNGNTLIVEVIANRVIEVAPDNEIVWEYADVDLPTDVERLENGNTLIADRHGHRVIEVAPDKETVWEYRNDSLLEIFGVQRLDNGNTLIVDDTPPARIIEVTPNEEVVWEYGGDDVELLWTSLGQRLDDGNTLIGDNSGMLNNSSVRVIEVCHDKEIVWEYDDGLVGVYTIQRLENGNTLICDQFNDRVIEVTPAKDIVWTYGAIDEPGGVQRLENGNTLIGVFGENRVIEVAGQS
jgi:hypothetical protein